ncbi:MAG: hypothetical protein MJA84_01640 [Firmicutes bacterium]|nr:hypothetical protein [Bacillota bacterium]
MTIATKEQERKVLEKVRKMIAELGENSYLSSAFDGAFALAEENIENDFGLSAREYIEKARSAEKTITDMKEDVKKTMTYLKAEKESHAGTIKLLNTIQERNREHASEKEVMEEALKAARLEIITLKARLYDFMVIEQPGA